MGYEELLHYLLDQLQAAFANTANVSLRRQPKNNGIREDTICILAQGDPVCPSISFSDCWKRYQAGEPQEALSLIHILQVFSSSSVKSVRNCFITA